MNRAKEREARTDAKMLQLEKELHQFQQSRTIKDEETKGKTVEQKAEEIKAILTNIQKTLLSENFKQEIPDLKTKMNKVEEAADFILNGNENNSHSFKKQIQSLEESHQNSISKIKKEHENELMEYKHSVEKLNADLERSNKLMESKDNELTTLKVYIKTY